MKSSKYILTILVLILFSGCALSNSKVSWEVVDSKPLGICVDGNCPAATCYAEIESDAGFYQTYEGEDELEHTIRTYSVLPSQTWVGISCYQEATLQSEDLHLKPNQTIIIDISYFQASGLQAYIQTNTQKLLLSEPAITSQSCENIQKKTASIQIQSNDILPKTHLTLIVEDSDGYCDYASMLWIDTITIEDSKNTNQAQSATNASTDCSAEIAKGSVSYVDGRTFIVRGVRTIPTTVGMELFEKDVVVVEEASSATIELKNGGTLRIPEKSKFEIPACVQAQEEGGFFTTIWTKAKKFIQGDSYEIKTPTAVAGVRG